MTNFLGVAVPDASLPVAAPGRVAEAHTNAPQFSGSGVVVDDPDALLATQAAGVYSDEAQKPASTQVDHRGSVEFSNTQAIDWFEKVHIIPRALAFGNILAPVQVDLEVFSAFRKDPHTWTSFTNNAGAGVTLVGAPSLPTALVPMIGVVMQVQVSTSGAPIVDATLDFLFASGLIPVPITLKRVILFDLPPEAPYFETLEFLTDIIPHKDGTEQRASPRKNPRQLFDFRYILTDGPERARIDNLLFDWQTRSFGVGIWREETKLTTPAAAGATTITVESTAYADYRTTGANLVLIYQDQTTFDVLPLDSLTASTLTLSSPLNNSYAAGVRVMPLRTGVVRSATISSTRHPVGASELQMRFRVEDNDVDLADVSAFNSYNSKVLLDECNGLETTAPESYDQEVFVLDNETGLTFQDSSWPNHRRGLQQLMYARGRQQQWEARGLLHALAGRRVSFYRPTFSKDLELAESLVSGSSTMAVTNVGYNRYVQDRQPKDVIRVSFVDGSTPLIRGVTLSVETSSVKETLTLDDSWPANFAIEDVSRVDYVEKVRIDSDAIRMQHLPGRLTKVRFPTKAVLG